MGRKIFDYNSVPVDPTLYTPQTSKKTESADDWFEGGTPIADNPDYKRSSYDDDILYSTDYIDPSGMRANNQGDLTKLGLSVLRGVTKGAAGAFEYAGYLGDVQEWLGLDTDEVDASYTNWLSELAKSSKESTDNLMPVYKQDPNDLWNNNDIAGSVAGALESTIDSAVSFGLLGLGVASAGTALAGALATTAAGSALISTSSALALNYTESKQMATEAIINVKALLDEKRNAGTITDLEYAQGLQNAAEEADKFIWRNKLNVWQDFLALRSLKNVTSGSRALVKQSTKTSNVIKDVLGESFEEVFSGALQNEAEYEAKRKSNLDVSKYKDNAIDRAFDYASSEQGIYEAVLGAIGGPIQSFAVNKPIEKYITKQSYKDKKQRQAQQEEFYSRNKASILATASKQKDISDKMNAALESGDIQAAADYHAETFAELAFNNFKMGTTEKLETHLQEILKDDSVSPEIKNFVKSYAKDLAFYEQEYNKIATRRNKETNSKKVGDIQKLANHVNIANEFKLSVLKKHNQNQVEAINNEIAKIDSQISQSGISTLTGTLDVSNQTLLSKKSELKVIAQTLAKNKTLNPAQKQQLSNKITSLKAEIKELSKFIKDSNTSIADVTPTVENLMQDREELVQKRVDYETAITAFDNQIQDIRKDLMTPDIKAILRKTDVASQSIQASKNVVNTQEILDKSASEAVDTLVQVDPNATDVDKAKAAKEAVDAQAAAIESYNKLVLDKASTIVNNDTLTTAQKIAKLQELLATINKNHSLNPTENDLQATSLKDYVLKQIASEVEILNKQEKDSYVAESKKPKREDAPKSEATKKAAITNHKFFTNSILPVANKFTDYQLLTAKQLSELLKNTSLDELNSKVKLVTQKFTGNKQDNNPVDLGNGYYTAKNQIRNIIAIVYDGKVLGYIYDPNKFFTLNNKSELVPVNFETLPESEIRKLYPDGDIALLRESWKEAQALQDYISNLNNAESVTEISNEVLKLINFQVNRFFGSYNLYSDISEWAELSSIPEGLINLPDGKQTYVIYDSVQEATLSNYPSQVSTLLSSLGSKQTPSTNLSKNKQFVFEGKPTGKSRYTMLVQLGNGTYEWVPLAPKAADTNSLFNDILETFKKSVASKSPIDFKQFPFRNLFIHTDNGDVEVSLRYSENGIIFTFENARGEGSKEVRIRISDFSKIKSFQDLLDVVNKRVTQVTPTNNYIPTLANGSTVQLTVSSFRKSVIAGKEAGNITETTDLTKDFVVGVQPSIFNPVLNLDISSKTPTIESTVSPESPQFNPENPFGNAVAEPDFNNAPEGAEVFTEEVVVETPTIQETKEDINSLTISEADWLYDNLKQITQTYNSNTLFDSIDPNLKQVLKFGDTTVTAIEPNAGGDSYIWFERPSGKWLIKISEKNNLPKITLNKFNDKGTYYALTISEEEELKLIKESGLENLINGIFKDTNVKQPSTRVEQFNIQNSLQQKYGLKRSYKDIVNQLKPQSKAEQLKARQQAKLAQVSKGKEFEGDTTSGPTVSSKMEAVVDLILEESKAEVEAAAAQDGVLGNDNVKKYFYNQLINYIKGLSFNTSLEKVLRKAKKAIITAGVVVSTAFNITTPSSIKEADLNQNPLMEYEEIVKNTPSSLLVNKLPGELDNLSVEAKKVYFYNRKYSSSSYVIVDKPTATIYLIDAEGNLIKSFPGLIGSDTGDQFQEGFAPNSYQQLDANNQRITPAGAFQTSYIEKSEYFQLPAFQLEGTSRGKFAVAFHATVEDPARQQAEKSKTTSDNNQTFGCISLNKTDFKNYVVPNFKGSVKIYVTKTSQDSVAFKIGQTKNETYNYEEAKTWLEKRLPSTITVKELDTVLNNLSVNGVPMGMLMNKILYLSNTAESGTEYHEAFHAAFRLLSTEQEITNLLNQAKRQFKAPTKADLDALKNQAEQNQVLSEQELTDLYYEEKMADKFQEVVLGKTKASWLSNLYNNVMRWLRFYTNNMDTMEAMFYKIDRGLYKNSTIKDNRFSNLNAFGVLKLLTKGVNAESGIRKTANADLSNKIIYTAASWIGNELQKDDAIKDFNVQFERFINMMASKYDWGNEAQSEKYLAMMENMDKDQVQALEDKVDEYYILYTDEGNKAIIYEQAQKLLKVFKVDSTEEQEKSKLAEESSERFDVDFFTLGGFDSMTAPVKEFIGLTLYNTTDEFGNEMQSGVDFIKVYNGLTAALAGAEDFELIPRMLQFRKHNPQTEAVIQKFIDVTGLVISPDGKSHTYNPEKSNEYNILLNAFKKEKVSFYTILHDNGANPQTRIIESNRRSSKQIQASNWASNFAADFNKFKENPEFKNELIAGLTESIKLFELSKPISEGELVALAQQLKANLSKLGITISQGYAEYSIAAHQALNFPSYVSDAVRSIYEPFSNTITSDLIVNPTHLYEMREALNRGENIYSKEIINEVVNKKGKKEKKKSTGTFTRILKISEGNTFFDENVIESTFTNAENQKVYNYLLRNQLMSKAKEFKSAVNRMKISSDRFINGLNHLLNFEFADKIFNNFNVALIDGIKPTTIEGDQDTETLKTTEGTTFGSMDSTQYLQTALSFFADQSKIKVDSEGNTITTAKYLFRQLEASNTGVLAELPVLNYFVINKDGSLGVTPLFKEHLANYIRQEWDKINRETIDFASPGRDVYSDYNDTLEGRAFKFWMFPQLNGIYSELAKTNGNQFDSHKNDMVNVVLESLSQEFAAFKETLKEEGLLIAKDKTSMKLIIGENLAYSNAEQWLGDFFTNDFLNSIAINQMYDGDYSLGRKHFLDMVKRHKGSIGYGIDLGEGVTNIVTVEDPVKFVEKGSLRSFSELNNEDQEDIIKFELERFKSENPNASEDEINRFKESLNLVDIKIGDAQSYVTVEHVILQLKRLGRFDKKVAAVYDKILKGAKINYSEVKLLEKSRAALNSRKTVTFDGNVYYKLSEIPLTPSLVKTPGFEWHANLLASMKNSNVDQVVFKSASKAAQKNVVKFSEDGNFDFTGSVNPVDNKYKRLQVETPSGKEEITAGTQLINLIISEQNPDLVVSYRGKDITIKELRDLYYNLLKDVREVSFKSAAQFLVDVNGKKDPKKAAKKFAETVENSGGSDLQIRYFTPDESGNPKYNWNIAPIIEKAEELFLAHFNKAYSVQKVEGTKASLVSDAGVRINGQSLKWGQQTADGKIWSECLMPRWIGELFDLKEGEEIPTEAAEMLGYRIPTQDKHSMVSLKVKGFLPNEYGSVIIVPKEVVLLSGADFDIDSLYISRYGVYKNNSGSLTRYGSAETIEDKFNEFVTYNLSKNKDLKSAIKAFELANAQAIKDKIKETGLKKKAVLEEFYPILFESVGLPGTLEKFTEVTNNGQIDINKGSLDNKILDAQMALFNNPHIQETIAKTPSTITPLKDIAAEVVKYRKAAGTVKNTSGYNGFSIMGRFTAFVNNSEGKRNIGPVALTNVANAELTSHNIEYTYANLLKSDVSLKDSSLADDFLLGKFLYLYLNDTPITGYSTTLDTNGKRKADSLSTIISAMTDNAKEALANLINLGIDIIPLVDHAVTQGIDLESAILMVNTPDMIAYARAKKVSKRQVNTSTVKIKDFITDVISTNSVKDLKLTKDELDEILTVPLTKEKASLTTDVLRKLVSINPTTYLKDKNVSREDKKEYLRNRVFVLNTLSIIDNQQAFIMNFSSLQSLYKGSTVDFQDNERFIEAINLLGVHKYFKDPAIAKLYEKGNLLYRKVEDPASGTFDLDVVFKNNPSLVALAENFSKINGPISQEYFITRTKAFNRVVETLFPAVVAKERYQISKQFLTFLSTTAYKRKVLSSPDNFMYQLMRELGESDTFGGLLKTKDGITTGEELIQVKTTLKNKGQRNYLLDRLSVLEDAIGMVTIEFPSMSKFNNAETNKLTDAFLELYTDDSTRDFSKKLFLYLFFKDNFKFKNNTFINNIAEFMFNDYSKSLDELQEGLSQDVADFSMAGFASEQEAFNTFADIFLQDYNNRFIIKSVKNVAKLSTTSLSKVISVGKIKYKSGALGNAITINKAELREYLKANPKPPKPVKYILNTLLLKDANNTFKGIPGFINEESVTTSEGMFTPNAVKSLYRLVSDTEEMVTYAKIPQIGKKNLSPYAFKQGSLLTIANLVEEKRNENFIDKVISKNFQTYTPNFEALETVSTLGENVVTEKEEVTDPSAIPTLPATGILPTATMENPFMNDTPSINSIAEPNFDDLPSGAVTLDENGDPIC